ncbi:MAG: amidohydrolase family protein, partial [Ignavibacteria bacterium]
IEMLKKNKLFLRIDSRLPFSEFANISKYKTEFEKLTDKIKFNSLKAFYDGSLSSKTAYMNENYKNSNHNGIRTEYVNSGEFIKAIFEIDKAGFQSSVHAIGDKAVSELLDLNRELINKNGKRDRRFRIEHAQHINEKDFKRFKDLNVIASVQPSHLFSDAKTSLEILQDPALEHNYKRLIDTGARVCFGTDFPVVSENPFETIYYAMTRNAGGFDNGFFPENRIPLSDCLESYTMQNAYATFEEEIRGNLEVGKFADIAILENDIFEMSPKDILNEKVIMTYFNGARVF